MILLFLLPLLVLFDILSVVDASTFNFVTHPNENLGISSSKTGVHVVASYGLDRVMSGENQDVRIKMEPFVGNDEDTRQLYCSDSNSSVDVKPVSSVTPSVSGYIELSSDDDGPARPAKKKRKGSSFFIRFVVREMATQTDGVVQKDVAVNTHNISKVEIGVNTDEPPKSAEIRRGTDANIAGDKNKGVKDADVDDNEPQTSLFSKDIYYQCSICSCYYLSFSLLQKHSRIRHNKSTSDKQRKVIYKSNCKFCLKSYVFNTYNNHIKTKHADQFTKTGGNNRKIGPYECTICKVKFLTYNEGNRHRKVHKNIDQKSVLKKIKTSEPSKTEAKSNKVVKTKSTTAHKTPIPKNVLFQCPKCELNFFTYRNGLRHERACENGEEKKRVEVKCTKCENKFLQVHIRRHNSQHEMANVFYIQKVIDGIEHRILYRCMKCKVCMEEPNCRRHFESDCGRAVGVPCTVCHLKVLRDFASKHKDAHAHMGLTKDEIMLVDICD